MPEIDLIKIREIALQLTKSTEGLQKRYLVDELKLGKEPRIKVLRGFRGLGKTTALLQLMAGSEKAVYFSVDHPYAESYGVYELGKACIQAGYPLLFIDEIHHYPEWKKETKALYDEFRHATIVLSGSAPLAFEPERRYEVTDVEPLSLREFAELQGRKIKVAEAWRSIDETLELLASHPWLHEYYEKYMQGGAWPLFFGYQEKTLPSLYYSIQKSIREDAPFFARVDGETIRAMEKLVLLLATAPLGEFSIHSTAQNLGISKYKAYEVVSLLESMRILRLVRPYGKGAKLVRGEPKLMFHHPNLRSAVCNAVGQRPSIGPLREELAVFSFFQRGWQVYTIKGMKKSPDYIVEKGEERLIIEIGGESKGSMQLRGFKEKTAVIRERQLITLALF